MKAEHAAIFDQLSINSQKFLLKVARRIVEGYEGEIRLRIKKGGPGRAGISTVEWVQVDDGDSVRDEPV